MTRLYEFSHNTFQTRGFPWAESVLAGIEYEKTCYACAADGRQIHNPRGTVTVQLEKRKGTRWGDALGCAWSLLIVSRRVLDDWDAAGIGPVPAHPIVIAPPLPTRLADTVPPDYFWLDGSKMCGARLDFEASGFVDVQFCPECGTRTDDISATYDRQHSGTWPLALIEGTWNGADIFTTDLSDAVFMCTERVVDCARRHKHTNFKFVPSEIAGSSTKGIKYM